MKITNELKGFDWSGGSKDNSWLTNYINKNKSELIRITGKQSLSSIVNKENIAVTLEKLHQSGKEGKYLRSKLMSAWNGQINSRKLKNTHQRCSLTLAKATIRKLDLLVSKGSGCTSREDAIAKLIDGVFLKEKESKRQSKKALEKEKRNSQGMWNDVKYNEDIKADIETLKNDVEALKLAIGDSEKLSKPITLNTVTDQTGTLPEVYEQKENNEPQPSKLTKKVHFNRVKKARIETRSKRTFVKNVLSSKG